MQNAFATIEQVYENPGGRVLRVVAGLACNVHDETVRANVVANATAVPTGWLKRADAHGGVAILCGSGPSLSDCAGMIREAHENGATIFAMNGAASFLWDAHEIMSDYQVFLDARPEMIGLIGPAVGHLFASQVDPGCFRACPSAQLWHCTHGEWIPEFPDHPDDYCVIGGSVSVGNTALALVYAMGFRDIRCFGYDSSHRAAKSHAFEQPLNAGDACTVTRFEGRDYVSSYAMKLQAETFLGRAKQLQELGCKITVEGDGLLPAKWRALSRPISEREKYEAMWGHEEYRTVSPGEHAVAKLLALESERGAILDLGCGTGRASVALAQAGFAPVLIDFTENSRDPQAREFEFHCLDLVRDRLPRAPFGFCADVMEHLPPEEVPSALSNILSACDWTFFTISTVPDAMGALIGRDLHLTVRPFTWWRDRIRESGGEIVCGEGDQDSVTFYVHSRISAGIG